ncbi:hypothetical protein C1H46_015450 [Malus baccata]|uniref:Uncharacterized protein n=1 Tax=Malus baccata TaxID=106549 RepID=A0A540MJM4_MALBA|nr:hypothetical protein C1H46_015450 [Malus baccata]
MKDACVDGYERSGSRIRRSRAGRPVRRMMACLPASTTWACPLESRSSHGLTPSPFFRSPPATDMLGIVGRVGSGQSCPSLGLWLAWMGGDWDEGFSSRRLGIGICKAGMSCCVPSFAVEVFHTNAPQKMDLLRMWLAAA